MLQLHMSDRQFYCLRSWNSYYLSFIYGFLPDNWLCARKILLKYAAGWSFCSMYSLLKMRVPIARLRYMYLCRSKSRNMLNHVWPKTFMKCRVLIILILVSIFHFARMPHGNDWNRNDINGIWHTNCRSDYWCYWEIRLSDLLIWISIHIAVFPG